MSDFVISVYRTNLTALKSAYYKGCSVLTVEVGGDGVPGHEAVDGNLIDDVE